MIVSHHYPLFSRVREKWSNFYFLLIKENKVMDPKFVLQRRSKAMNLFRFYKYYHVWIFFLCFDLEGLLFISSHHRQGRRSSISSHVVVEGLSLKSPISSSFFNRRNSLSFDENDLYYGYRYDKETVEQTMSNLMSVVGNIQNPELYSSAWADACEFDEDKNCLCTHCEIQEEGEILSLYPIDAIGLMESTDDGSKIAFITPNKHVDLPNAHRFPLSLLDEEAFPYPLFHGRRQDLFILTNSYESRYPGWIGHLVDDQDSSTSNCIILPLPGAAPFCALVSTCPIPKHQRLVLSSQSLTTTTTTITTTSDMNQVDGISLQHLYNMISHKYAHEIAELKKYTDMAYVYPTSLYLPLSTSSNLPSKDQFKFPFYYLKMNHEYPNIHLLHKDPHIMEVPGFLSLEECDSLIEIARPNLVPCVIRDTDTGEVQTDPNRSSTNANIPRRSITKIMKKIMFLTNCPDERYFETFQVLRYEGGQLFQSHRDGFPGPTTACGFHQSGRLVTIFVYLNTLLPHQGGQTRFTKLTDPSTTAAVTDDNSPQQLDITPEKGKAVIHFPNTIGLEEDVRTSHAGLPPTLDNDDDDGIPAEKWLFVTWIWKNFRSDEIYSEQKIVGAVILLQTIPVYVED